MPGTHEIRVSLDERQYAAIPCISRSDERQLAEIVRDVIDGYCVAPEARRRLDAIASLYAMDPAPAPTNVEQWEREYSALKTGAATGCAADPVRLA